MQRADEESYMCYILFVLIFVLDFSLFTMLFPFSLAAYALATQKPSRRYWQVQDAASCVLRLFESVRCCAMLCCAVLCCAVLCCAVLCCAVLCCDVLCCAVALSCCAWAGLPASVADALL